MKISAEPNLVNGRRAFVRTAGVAVAAALLGGCAGEGDTDVEVGGAVKPAAKPAAGSASVKPAPAPATSPAAQPAAQPAAPVPAAVGEKLILAKVWAKPAKIDTMLAAARKCIAASRKEQGNVFYDFLRDTDEPFQFLFVERWKSQQAIDTHNATAHFKEFMPVLKDAADKVEILVYDLGTAAGAAAGTAPFKKIILARALAKFGDERALISAARQCVAGTRKEAGNVSYEFLRDTEDPLRFIFVERWKDQSAIDSHNATAHFKTFFAAAKGLLQKDLAADYLDILAERR